MNMRETGEALSSLAVFRSVLEDETVSLFAKMCMEQTLESRGAFAQSLYKISPNFSRVLLKATLLSENIISQNRAENKETPEIIEKEAARELGILQEASRTMPFGTGPLWETEEIDFAAEFAKWLENIGKTGYGIFAKNNMFTLEGSEIVPEALYDDTPLSALKGYSRQKKAIGDNLRAMLSGLTAANMLLYGDSGTGKSATIKAMTNEYAPMGLRLIEIKKHQIDKIPAVMAKLSKNPLKFILFLDDLSFDSADDVFGSLKAVLEGSVAARAKNTCVCVTSNRRHIVRESKADRMGADLHVKDTMEEIGALTQRFGLSVIFEKPDKAMYFEILEDIGKDNGMTIDDALLREAEAYAIQKGGRSCRVAKLFIEQKMRESHLSGEKQI